MANIDAIREKFAALDPLLDEHSRRIWAATEAKAMGWGGVSVVASATGMARNTVHAGVKDLTRGRHKSRLNVYEGTRRIRR